MAMKIAVAARFDTMLSRVLRVSKKELAEREIKYQRERVRVKRKREQRND